METYDSKSCNALEKPYYRPIEAALRWCNLINHEIEILKSTGMEILPPISAFPQWPCLRANSEKIWDAIQNREIHYGRDGQTVPLGEQVARHRITVRHTDLKAWMAKNYPDQKPKFLFDEIERNTHTAINKDAFFTLHAERDALKARIEKAEAWASAIIQEKKQLITERDKLRKLLDEQGAPGKRAETTYLNIIGGLVDLMLGTTPGGQKGSAYANQSAIISALLAHHGGKPGIAESTLEQKFSEAKKSIQAS